MISVGSEVQVLPGPPVIALSCLASIQGDIAQLVEHLLCKQGVTGSNPVVSIIPGPRQRMCSRSECKGIIPRRVLELFAEGEPRFDPKEAIACLNCIAWKGHEIVACGVLRRNPRAHVNRH